MNISFENPELCHIHLCLHAPKLDLKGAAGQLLGAYSLSSLLSELVEADFGARSRLAEALLQWTSSQAMLGTFKTSLTVQFGNNIPSTFMDHRNSLAVLAASLLSSVKDRTEEFFKARKACRDRIFTGCSANLCADLLLKSFPFSTQLFEQSVVDTILSELRTAHKAPGSAFGKCVAPDRSRSRSRVGKEARKWEQVNNRNPFSRNSPKETKGTTNLLPEANATRGTEAEVVARTIPLDLKIHLLHRIDVGGRLLGFRDAWRHNAWAFRVASRGLTWR